MLKTARQDDKLAEYHGCGGWRSLRGRLSALRDGRSDGRPGGDFVVGHDDCQRSRMWIVGRLGRIRLGRGKSDAELDTGLAGRLSGQLDDFLHFRGRIGGHRRRGPACRSDGLRPGEPGGRLDSVAGHDLDGPGMDDMIKVVRVRPGGKHCRRFQPLAFARTLRITVIGLVAVGFVVTGWGPPTIRPAGAASPDPLPAYSHSRRLRQESRLHGIAAAGRVVLAVGDRGTILRSVDAGQTWETAESRTDAALESVAIDAAGKAVIVGGGYDRVTGISRGVVLVSDDAGRSWTRGACEDLPKLHSVRHDAGDRRFQAVGNFSFADLTDRFESFDGGRRWQGAQAASGPPGGGGAGTSVSPATSRNRLSDWAAATPIRSAVRTVCQNPSDSVLFAAGDHGVILRRARDEEDWSVAHGNGRTSSVLIVTSSPGRTPWQLIGSEALEMRQRVSVLWWDLLDSTTPPQDP